eukprot:3010768-Amphidinium_carterae.3
MSHRFLKYWCTLSAYLVTVWTTLVRVAAFVLGPNRNSRSTRLAAGMDADNESERWRRKLITSSRRFQHHAHHVAAEP